jgi:hypothetical protein
VVMVSSASVSLARKWTSITAEMGEHLCPIWAFRPLGRICGRPDRDRPDVATVLRECHRRIEILDGKPGVNGSTSGYRSGFCHCGIYATGPQWDASAAACRLESRSVYRLSKVLN